MRGARPWGSGRAAASQPAGAGLGGGATTLRRVGTFFVGSDVCVWAEEERGVSVGPCGVHEGKRGSPMARGDAVARVAAWSERPAPPHHSLWAARRAQLISSLLERTATNAHGLRTRDYLTSSRSEPKGDSNVRFFIRVRFWTVYLVIKLSPGTPLFPSVSELSSCLAPSARSQRTARLRRPRNVRVAPTKQSL